MANISFEALPSIRNDLLAHQANQTQQAIRCRWGEGTFRGAPPSPPTCGALVVRGVGVAGGGVPGTNWRESVGVNALLVALIWLSEWIPPAEGPVATVGPAGLPGPPLPGPTGPPCLSIGWVPLAEKGLRSERASLCSWLLSNCSPRATTGSDRPQHVCPPQVTRRPGPMHTSGKRSAGRQGRGGGGAAPRWPTAVLLALLWSFAHGFLRRQRGAVVVPMEAELFGKVLNRPEGEAAPPNMEGDSDHEEDAAEDDEKETSAWEGRDGVQRSSGRWYYCRPATGSLWMFHWSLP